MATSFRTFLVLLQQLLFFVASSAEANDPRETYLVQMKVGGHRYGSSSGHQELLCEVLDDDSTIEDAFIYRYSESFTGLPARLTQSECQKLRRRREVLEGSRSRDLKLQTTRSWDFMNLTLEAQRNPENESDLVVAVIDTGIWPYSEVFLSDSPPPPGWENKCEDITCNKYYTFINRSLFPTEMTDEGNEFAYGSGHLNAAKVLDPGLVYETHYQDYIDYMCKQGYNTEKLRSDAGSDKIDCSKTEIDPKADLNYPTMTARVPLDAPFEKIFRRTVTNVYDGESTYRGEINYPRGDKAFNDIIVDPPQLQFSELGQNKTFTVTVTGTSKPNWKAGKAFMTRNTWLTWTEIDGSRKVRSPIVIYSDEGPEACT
ncbi:PREDICTED: subtilisin-like protease SBT4.1 [Camelina sativa]|uniref:Subtilisin-like protease SBT4.1 n=1 Tax=Camelina sativa TaxID=90675 RepID=A0ABM1RSH3_CAMSA|nr:PREDICTED: subtilisin-like protease SBT4.1 [Camelina sativa]